MKEYFYHRSYSYKNEELDHKMYITPNGISIVFRNGKMLDTDLIPSQIYPGREKLTPKEIEDFHRFIKFQRFQSGKLYTKKQFEDIVNRYNKEIRPKVK